MQKYIVGILIFILFYAEYSSAQRSSINNLVFVGARPTGMGETFVAVADDGNAIYWNPAGLPFLESYEFNSMYSNLFNTGVKNNYISFVFPYSERITMGMDWFNINLHDDGLDFSRNKFNLSIGMKLLHNLSIGMNLKRILTSAAEEGRSEGNGAGWGADIGVLFNPGSIVRHLDGLRFGIMTHDFTDTNIKYDTGVSETILLRNIRYGICYETKKIFLFENSLVALDIDDRIHIGAEFWLPSLLNTQLGFRSGIQKDIYEYGEDELIYSFGGSLKYKLKDRYVLNFDYSYTDFPTLINTSRFSLGFQFALPASPVKIEHCHVNDFYTSLYLYHMNTSCGSVNCRYKDQKKLDVNVKLHQSQYNIICEEKITLNPEIQPMDTLKKVNLIPAFTDKIFDIGTDDNKLYAEIMLEPKILMRTKQEKMRSNVFTIYGLNKINWNNGDEQIVAFITPKDEYIRNYAIGTIGKYQNTFNIISENLTYAILIFAELRNHGISWLGDENSTYGKKPIDNVYYARQLLKQKRGDCDDITVLFASLLESIGIETKLIITPNHVFMMFNSGLHKKYISKLCMNKKMVIVRDNNIWIPVETTLIGDSQTSFLDAWENAVDKFENSDCSIIDVKQLWEKYPPVPEKVLDSLVEPKAIPGCSKEPLSACEMHFKSIQHYRRKNLQQMEQEVKRHPQNLKLRHKLATTYGMIGNFDFMKIDENK